MSITIEALELEPHLARLHGWITHPGSVYWEMPEASIEEVAQEYAQIRDNPQHHAWLGRVDGEPAFLAETYDPAHSLLAGLPELREGDLGMHLLVAPTVNPVPGFTRRVFRAVMEHCFADPATRRVVVDPDVRNDKIKVLNALAGFEVERAITLPSKDAALSFCTREAFLTSELARGEVDA